MTHTDDPCRACERRDLIAEIRSLTKCSERFGDCLLDSEATVPFDVVREIRDFAFRRLYEVGALVSNE